MIPREVQVYLDHRFQIQAISPLAGGDINQVYRVDSHHHSYCLKINSSSRFPGMFEKEAMGLSILREANELRIPLVAEVINLSGYSGLLLEFVSSVQPEKDFMFRFGIALARLHDHSSSGFGLDQDNYIGSLHQSNKWHDRWIDFFTEERLEKQLRIAVDSGQVDANTNKLFSRLISRLDLLLSGDHPSLLHGDLWSGNFMVSENGEACLIDPAVYYGHREADLAMTTLFGGFSPEFYRGYETHHELVSGWRNRLDLYNLYPLLVHVNLFGGGYVGSVKKILQKFS